MVFKFFGFVIIIIGWIIFFIEGMKNLSIKRKYKKGSISWVKVVDCDGMDDWYHLNCEKLHPNSGTVEVFTEKKYNSGDFLLIETTDEVQKVIEKDPTPTRISVCLLIVGIIILAIGVL